jgi:hypothetical protein
MLENNYMIKFKYFIETSSNNEIIKANSLYETISQLEKKTKLNLKKQDLSTNYEVKNCEHYNSCNQVSKSNAVRKKKSLMYYILF